ncbi:MAG: ROK family protein [Succinivibrio sp.]
MYTTSQTISSKNIREQNLQLVRRALHDEQVCTASSLKDKTGLSVVTLNKILSILIATGEVIESGKGSSGNGRPAATYRFNEMNKLMLVLSVYMRSGHKYVGYSVHNLFGECLERREELIDDKGDIQINEFRDGMERYIENYPKIAVIGVSMPSDDVGGRVGSAIRHDSQSVRLSDHLEKHFKIPVFFETDINAATLGCYKRCKNQEYVSGVILVPGKIPGCGFCYNGQVLRGKDGMAGEIRYFPMYNDVGVLPSESMQADDLAIRTIRAVMCVLNPGYMAVYTETLKSGLIDRLRKQLSTAAEEALLPKIEITDNLREDTVSGMISLCLLKLENL